MSHQKYYDYLQSLGHVLKLDENGNVDAFGHDFENHNGPSCINCGASWCHHCEEDAQVCEKELNSPPDVYDIVVDTGDGIYYTAEVVHFQQKGSKRMIQVRIGEPQSDDVRKDAELDWIENDGNHANSKKVANRMGRIDVKFRSGFVAKDYSPNDFDFSQNGSFYDITAFRPHKF